MSLAVREFLKTRGGTFAAAGLFLLIVVLVIVQLADSFGTSQAGALSRDRLFICAKTGQSFRHTLEAGEPIPVRSPHSGADTGYPAELCYWTADGQIRQAPTPVLLNNYIEENPGPTFCPDCDRLVVSWNPRPQPGQVPPTRAQVEARATAVPARAVQK